MSSEFLNNINYIELSLPLEMCQKHIYIVLAGQQRYILHSVLSGKTVAPNSELIEVFDFEKCDLSMQGCIGKKK